MKFSFRNRKKLGEPPKVVPAHGTLEVVKVAAEDELARGHSIVDLDIETDCSFIGVYPINAANVPLTGELGFAIQAKRQRVSALMPRGTSSIVIKNLTSVTAPRRCRFAAVGYSRFEDISSFASAQTEAMIRTAAKKVFIHCLGKSGSASLQETLYPLEKVICARDHFINLPIMSEGSGHAGTAILRGLSPRELNSCRIMMHLMRSAASDPDFLDVICGLRKFDTQLLAGIFQNRGMSFVGMQLSPEAVLAGIYKTAEANGVPHYHYWWEKEFFVTHGFTIDDLEGGLRKEGLTWVYRAPSGIGYRFYRIEDGEGALRESLLPYARFAADPASFPQKIASTNTGDEKGYADLYRAVRERLDLGRVRSWRSPLLQRIEALFYGG